MANIFFFSFTVIGLLAFGDIRDRASHCDHSTCGLTKRISDTLVYSATIISSQGECNNMVIWSHS